MSTNQSGGGNSSTKGLSFQGFQFVLSCQKLTNTLQAWGSVFKSPAPTSKAGQVLGVGRGELGLITSLDPGFWDPVSEEWSKEQYSRTCNVLLCSLHIPSQKGLLHSRSLFLILPAQCWDYRYVLVWPVHIVLEIQFGVWSMYSECCSMLPRLVLNLETQGILYLSLPSNWHCRAMA